MFWKIFPFSLFPVPFQDIFNDVVVDGFSEKAGPAQALPIGAAYLEYHGNIADGKNAAELL